MEEERVRYVFLDRDGVLNRKPPEGEYVTAWSQFHWLPGAGAAIARMNRAGLTVIIVTNQRGIALGLYTTEQLEHIHANMQKDLSRHHARVDAIYSCPHDRDVCRCRKPGIGMFEQAFLRFPEANAANSVFIGDSLSDMQAGKNLGMSTIFIDADSDPREESAIARKLAGSVASSLQQAVEMNLKLGA